MSLDLDALVNGPVRDAFGEAVTYTPQSGAPFALTAVFDDAYRSIEIDREGAGISSVHPAMQVKLSDFATPPAQDDTLVRAADGRTYTVKDVQPDGLGWALVTLMRSS